MAKHEKPYLARLRDLPVGGAVPARVGRVPPRWSASSASSCTTTPPRTTTSRRCAPFIEDGSVTVHDWPVLPRARGRPTTTASPTTATRRAGSRSSTADEFLFSPTGRPLPDVLRDYEQHPGMGVSRRLDGDLRARDQAGGARARRTSPTRLHLPEPNRSVKSIVDPSRVAAPRERALVRVRGRGPTVDEHQRPLDPGSGTSSPSTCCGSTTTSRSPRRRRSQVRPAAGRRRQAPARS